MKGLKKLLAGILTMAMAMSMMSMPVFADNNTPVPTIDTTKEVSLTIYKYRYDADTTNPDDHAGKPTGTAADLTSGVIPDSAELLNGVTFKVYKVADFVQEKADGSSTYQLKYKTLNAVKTALDAASVDYISGGMTATEINALFTEDVLTALEADDDYKTDYISEATTKTVAIDGKNTDGIAQFTNDMLAGQGLYLVVETDAPDVVTSKVDSFLVSLPMTNVTGDDWLYDVYAFPKNGTTTGEITLKKTGKIGNGLPSDVSATFVLQKWMEVTENQLTTEKWVTLTKNDNGEKINGSTDAADDGSKIVVPGDGKGVKISGLSQGKYRFVEIKAPDDEYIMDGVAYEFWIKEDGKVYRYNESSTNTDKLDPMAPAEIIATNYKPEVEKEVLKKGGTATNDDDWQEAADYSVGDHVPFKVSATVPTNIAKLKHYALVDTLSAGLTMDTDDEKSFVVTYYKTGNVPLTEAEVTAAGLPTGSAASAGHPTYDSNNNKWTFDLKNYVDKLADNKIVSIEVTFNATLNNKAVTADTGNPNTIGLEYTNKLYPEGYEIPADEPYEETKTITDKVVVYTFGIELVKKFTDGAPSATINATFDLYREAVDTDQAANVTKIKVGNSEINVVKVGTYTTDANGQIVINTTQTAGTDNDTAFSNNTYYFVETATAAGYNLLKEPVPVEIQLYYTQTFKTTTTVTKYDANGNMIGSPAVTETGTDTTTYYTDANKTATTTVTTTSIKVVNNSGFDLPSTGGIGTFVFTFVGIAMMAAAVILFITSRKKKEDK